MIPLEQCEKQELDENLQKGFNKFREDLLKIDFEQMILIYQEAQLRWVKQ